MDGRKDDTEKPRYDLLPPVAIDVVARVLTFGAQKYAPGNWRRVAHGRHRYPAAALRHIFAYLRGETHDSETGLPHLAHAACCLLFSIELDETDLHVD